MNRFILTLGCALAMEVAAIAQNTTTSPNSQDLARSLSKSFADVYAHVSPAVVVIESETDDSSDDYPAASPLIQFFGQDPRATPRHSETNQGSGFIITADGYILTNNHVLEGASPKTLQVTLQDGRKLPARIVGVDEVSDLAVVKIEGTNLPVIELGDSDKTRVGEFAFAIGSPFDLQNSFTYGVVSAKGRTEIDPSNPNYQEYLQTDASINPGNSGGPLVDIDGRVIGVNTLIRDLNRGLGFAIPINIAKKVATQLIADGRAVRPWLGIGIASVDDLPKLAARYADVGRFLQRFPNLPPGIMVTEIRDGTPASLSDLRAFDVIVKVDGRPVTNSRELQKAVFEKTVGESVTLDVWRGGRLSQVKLRTAEHTEGFRPVVNLRTAPPVDDDADPAPGSIPKPRSPAPSVAPSKSPSAGLTVKTLNADMAFAMKLQAQEGVLVTSVQPGSPAAAAGVRVGDVITSVGSKAVTTREGFLQSIAASGDDAIMLNINRGDEKTYEILKP